MMSDYSGEDLLSVFSDLDVRLFKLSPTVIKAWFDTDNKDLKNLLTWMCISLSKKNYVSPLENKEFLELENRLEGEKYEQELAKIETEYPGIFDVDSNALEIEFLEDNIELLLEEEAHLDDLIRRNEILQNDLSLELSKETSIEIKTSVKCRSAQETCNTLGTRLDKLNAKLYSQLVKYGVNLYNFEFGETPNFISNMDMKECQENFDNVMSFLSPLLEHEVFSGDVTGTDSQMFMGSIKNNNSIAENLSTMRHRILHSHQNYLVAKLEVDKLKEMLMYLNRTDPETILLLTESAGTLTSREGKEETKRRMCGMLDNISAKLADHHIAQTKLKYAQRELEQLQAKLDCYKTIENLVLKFLSQYFILSVMYVQEKNDFDNSDSFLRRILHYITKDLQSCSLRTEKMKEVITEYRHHKSKPLGERYQLIKSIIKIFSNEEDFDLSTALGIVSDFKSELNMLECKIFSSDFNEHRTMTEELRNDINILQKFLVSGPTHRIVLVPSELHFVLQEVKEQLKRQILSVKSAMEISANTKKIPNKWQNYRRQLWMYFYTDPPKLFSILQQVEEEFKKHKISGVQCDM